MALRRLAWVTGGFVGCGALLMGARLTLPAGTDLSTLAALATSAAEESELTPAPDTEVTEAAPPHKPVDATPATDPAAPDPASQEQTINQALQRHGLSEVRVQLSEDGIATVSGQVPEGTDVAALLQWLATAPGVSGVEDALAR